MGNTYAISALVRRRGELAWRLYEAGKLHRGISKEFAELDRTLLAFGYENDPARIAKRRKNAPRMFKRGKLRRIIFDILREGLCIETDRQYAIEVMRRLKWDIGDESLLLVVTLKVRDVRKAIGQ